jgi:hypothetical protein
VAGDEGFVSIGRTDGRAREGSVDIDGSSGNRISSGDVCNSGSDTGDKHGDGNE